MNRPAQPVKRRRGAARGRRLPKALERKLWDRILTAAAQDRRYDGQDARDQALIGVAFGAGLRSFELVALNVADVDIEAGVVLVAHGKGDKERRPALSGFACELVEAYLDVRPECQLEEKGALVHPLFVSRKRGRMSTSAVRRLVGRIEALLEISGIHPHAFRHSHITEIVRAAERKGTNIFEVAEQAGHADLDTTRLYYAAVSEKRKKLVDDI